MLKTMYHMCHVTKTYISTYFSQQFMSSQKKRHQGTLVLSKFVQNIFLDYNYIKILDHTNVLWCPLFNFKKFRIIIAFHVAVGCYEE